MPHSDRSITLVLFANRRKVNGKLHIIRGGREVVVLGLDKDNWARALSAFGGKMGNKHLSLIVIERGGVKVLALNQTDSM